MFGNRTGKAVVEIADLQIDQVLDAQYHGQIHAAVFDTGNHVRQRHIGLAQHIRRCNLQLAIGIDTEVTFTPIRNVIQGG